MHHRPVPARHRHQLHHITVQKILKHLPAESLFQAGVQSHKHQQSRQAVCRLYHHSPLSLPQLLGAIEQHHNTSLQKVVHHHGEEKIKAQTPEFHRKSHSAEHQDTQVQHQLQRQGLQMRVQQHTFGRYRGREQKMHIALPVHQPLPPGIGNQICGDHPEGINCQHRRHALGRVHTGLFRDHFQGKRKSKDIEAKDHQVHIRPWPAQSLSDTVYKCPHIEITNRSHDYLSLPSGPPFPEDSTARFSCPDCPLCPTPSCCPVTEKYSSSRSSFPRDSLA